jgi:hypothetical protein
MPTQVSRLKAASIIGLCACVIGASSGAAAQGRFELLGGDAIQAIQGLSVYTVRDRRTAVCYTLFVLGPLDAVSSSNMFREPALTAEDLGKIHVAETLKQAAALRDQNLMALRSQTNTWAGRIEVEQQRIEDEYEGVVRHLLPGVYPTGRLSPAWRTTTPDALNDAVRQAIADADAITAAATRSTLDDQLLQLLNRVTQSARLAVAGPVACAPAAGAAK